MAAEINPPQLTELLAAISALAEAAGRRDVVGTMNRIVDLLDRAGNDNRQRRNAIQVMLSLYTQGTGGLQDIVLWKPDVGVLPEQARFAELLIQAYDAAVRELGT